VDNRVAVRKGVGHLPTFASCAVPCVAATEATLRFVALVRTGRLCESTGAARRAFIGLSLNAELESEHSSSQQPRKTSCRS
jgi:hypothetical protein